MSDSLGTTPQIEDKPIIPENLDAAIALNALYAIVISCACFFVFLIFRRKFKWVYLSNTASFGPYHPLLPEGRRGYSSLRWIKYTLGVSDANLLTMVGMDAFILIMVLKMLFWIFLILSILASVFLLPVYARGTYGSNASTTTTQLYSRLSIAHLESESPWLWVPAIAVWIFSLIFVYILVLFYASYVHLRQAYIASPASLTSVYDLIAFYRVTGSLERTYAMLDIPSRTVLVQGLDVRRFKSEENVTAFFDQCSIGMVMESVFIKDHPHLRELIKERNNVLRALESACVTLAYSIMQLARDYRKNPDLCIIPDSLEAAMSKEETIDMLVSGDFSSLPGKTLTPARKRALLLHAFNPSFAQEIRPTIKKSFWQKLFKKTDDGEEGGDLISFLGKRLASLDRLIEAVRLEIVTESQQLIASNTQAMESEMQQANSLRLPHHSLINDTRLLLVEASSSTPALSEINSVDTRIDMPDKEAQTIKLPEIRGMADPKSVFFSHSLLSDTINNGRLALPGQTKAAFVTFREAVAASVIAQVLIDGTPFSCRASLAPRPNEILWMNIGLPASLRAIRSWTAMAAVIVLNLTWFIPVSFVDTLNQINRIATVIPILRWVLRLPQPIQTFIEGLVAPALLSILLLIMPYALEVIARYEGAPSRTALQRSTMRKYLAFLYLQTFLVNFLSGSVFAALIPFINGNLASIVDKIRQVLVPNSSFFFKLITMKIANELFVVLANPVGLFFYFSLGALTRPTTPRERHEARAPERLNYAVIIPLLLFAVPLVMTYAVISPLMLGVGTLYYGIATLVYRYRFLYSARTTLESGGAFLYDVTGFLCVGLATFQVMTAIQLFFQKARIEALVVLPSLLVTLGTWRLLKRVTRTASAYVPVGARPDLASAAAYPNYKRSIPRLHQKDATSLGAALGGRSTLDLVAVLIARQKTFLAETEVSGNIDEQNTTLSEISRETFLRPTPSSEAVPVPQSLIGEAERQQKTKHTPNTASLGLNGDDSQLSRGSLNSHNSEASQKSNSTSDESLRETVEWYMSNPYRNPTLFKKLNSLYLPRIFFQIIQLLSKEEDINEEDEDHHDDSAHDKDHYTPELIDEEGCEDLSFFISQGAENPPISHRFSSIVKPPEQVEQVKEMESVDGSDQSTPKQPPSLSLTSIEDGTTSSLVFSVPRDSLPTPVIKLPK